MNRITITIDDGLLTQLDAHMASRGYASRSEAMRDLLRDALERERMETAGAADAVATLTYVYDHEQRELGRKMTGLAHAHTDLTLSTLHVHLDQETCLEVSVLRGPSHDIRHFADEVTTERGVRHGRLHVMALQAEDHAAEPPGHGHRHRHPGKPAD